MKKTSSLLFLATAYVGAVFVIVANPNNVST
jgi:hypothetical protein